MGNINEEEEINMTHMSPYYAIDSLPLKAKNVIKFKFTKYSCKILKLRRRIAPFIRKRCLF